MDIREKWFENKTLLALAAALVAVLAVFYFTNLLDILLTFLLAGVIPGTHLVVPYWFMMAVYCALITIIATPYIERFLKIVHEKRHSYATHRS